jgi:hypothetical protein
MSWILKTTHRKKHLPRFLCLLFPAYTPGKPHFGKPSTFSDIVTTWLLALDVPAKLAVYAKSKRYVILQQKMMQ